LLTPERFYGDDAPRNYAAAWSFADLLLRGSGSSGIDLVRRIFGTVREGKASDVIQDVENAGLTRLEDEWRARLARGSKP
jgi:hypothetical protein